MQFEGRRLTAGAMCLTALAWTVPAGALVVSGGREFTGGQWEDLPAPDNSTPPPVDLGWDRVGDVGNGSGVYLGNGYVLTARHVSNRTSIDIDGEVYDQISGSSAGSLKNANNSDSDIYLFRVAVPEGSGLHGLDPVLLPNVSMAGSSFKTQLIGYGLGQEELLPINLGSNLTGYNWDPGSGEKRWGEINLGGSTTFPLLGRDTEGMSATFSNIANRAAVTPGDSGGGVFWNGKANNGTVIQDGPVLVGLLHAVQQLSRPGNSSTTSAAFNDKTLLSDITQYADQLSIVDGDFNGDGIVDQGDLELVSANWGMSVDAGNFLLGDGSGDGMVGVADMDIVLAQWGNGTLVSPITAVPEPGTLGVLIMGGWLLGRRRRR